jgi:hypothetical protein
MTVNVTYRNKRGRGRVTVTYGSDEQRRLIEDLANRFGMTVVEVANLARSITMVELDPIVATGERFEFNSGESAEPDFFYISEKVPPPDARVDLIVAWRRAQQDARVCLMILARDPSLPELLKVARNSLAWCRFWAVRDHDPEWRERYAREAGEWEAGIEDWNRKGLLLWMTGNGRAGSKSSRR